MSRVFSCAKFNNPTVKEISDRMKYAIQFDLSVSARVFHFTDRKSDHKIIGYCNATWKYAHVFTEKTLKVFPFFSIIGIHMKTLDFKVFLEFAVIHGHSIVKLNSRMITCKTVNSLFDFALDSFVERV